MALSWFLSWDDILRETFLCTNSVVGSAVNSGQLEWLPEGSQLEMASSVPSGAKQKTYTSFSRCQKEISEKSLRARYKDITIARLGCNIPIFRSS